MKSATKKAALSIAVLTGGLVFTFFLAPTFTGSAGMTRLLDNALIMSVTAVTVALIWAPDSGGPGNRRGRR